MAAGTLKAWVNFNGTGTVAIRASGNVSSITDNGIGNYFVNFTVALPDPYFAAFCNAVNDDGVFHGVVNAGNRSASACQVYYTTIDCVVVEVVVFR